MVRQRVVLGATGDGGRAAQAAPRLRDAGWEVIYVGGDQTPEQLVHTMIAEDARTIVVDGDAAVVAGITALCAELGVDDGDVTPLDEARPVPRPRR